MRTKAFDCVEMKRQGSLRVHEQLKGLTVEQQIDYWRQRSRDFRRDKGRLRAKGVLKTPAVV
jgi:hypothetical protein